MFFLEGSDSNALRLVYGSDGNNPESWESLGRVLNNMSRLGFTKTIHTKTERNMSTALIVVSETQTGI